LQLDEQSIGLLEIARIEAFAEATIDGCKNVARPVVGDWLTP
jgi:hypothetical protein